MPTLTVLALSGLLIIALGAIVWLSLMCVSRKRLIQELRDSLQQLEDEQKNKEEFLANLGSDLELPTHQLVESAEALLDSPYTSPERPRLLTLKRLASEVQSSVADLHDYCDAQAGRLKLRQEPFAIRDLVSEVVAAMAIEARFRSLELAFHIQPLIPYQLIGDQARLRQILGHLLDNAIKYTEVGDVTLRVALESKDEQTVRLRFSVRDTGVGLTDVQLESIFPKDSSISHHPLQGLGLRVCRELVALFEGQIWAESEVGRGSTFHCSLPFHEGTATDLQSTMQTQLGLVPDMPVLVIDERESTSEILAEMLENHGATPSCVPSTPVGLEELARAKDSGTPYGLILIDGDQIEDQGTSFLASLRRDPKLTSTPSILIVSPQYTVKPPANCVLLEKPIRSSRLAKSMVRAVLGKGRYQQVSQELQAAENYVRDLLPPPTSSPVPIDWRYTPAATLGGDALGYNWIDDQHCAFYVLDVTGHGIDSALLSVSILNLLRTQTLPETDFRSPGTVLWELNNRFPMESHGDRCFSMWYGVYNVSTRTITWAGGGHPPAFLLNANEQRAEPLLLESSGPLLGMLENSEFEESAATLERHSMLYVYSDGVFEIEEASGRHWTFAEFKDFMRSAPEDGLSRMDRLWRKVNTLRDGKPLDDDFTILEARLG